jgi:hypothetical protein
VALVFICQLSLWTSRKTHRNVHHCAHVCNVPMLTNFADQYDHIHGSATTLNWDYPRTKVYSSSVNCDQHSKHHTPALRGSAYILTANFTTMHYPAPRSAQVHLALPARILPGGRVGQTLLLLMLYVFLQVESTRSSRGHTCMLCTRGSEASALYCRLDHSCQC